MQIDPSYLIKPETPIEDLVNFYPRVVDFLIKEYDFYCMNCIMAEWETFIEGCSNHGIIGADFEEALRQVNEIVAN